MLTTTQLIGFGAGGDVSGGGPITATYIGRVTNTSTLTTYTFSSAGIGTAASDRFVVLAIGLIGSSGLVNSVTIGGVAATELYEFQDSIGSSVVAFYGLIVTSGTTADIVVTLASSATSCGVAIYNVNGNASVATTDTMGAESSTVTASGTIDCDADGCIIACAGCPGSFIGAVTNFTWVGVTERVDQSLVTNSRWSSAMDNFASAQTGLTISATTDELPNGLALGAIALR